MPTIFVGLILQSVASVVFGYADDLTGGHGVNPNAALAVYTLSRLACGAGAAFANTAIFSLAVERFGGRGEKDKLGEVNGWNEVAIGAGFCVGPPVGTMLYLAGGFGFPFLIASVVMLAFAPCAFLLRQRASLLSEYAKQVECSLLSVLKPGLLVPAGSVFLGTAIFGIVEPLLSLYLENEVGIKADSIGTVFAAFSVAYAASAPVVGMLADRVGALRICSLGTMLGGLTMALLLGRTAGTFEKGTNARITYEVAVLVMLGSTQAATLIPTLSAMGQGLGCGADIPGAQDCISAWFLIFLNLGLSIGPLAGTALVQCLGFEDAVSLCGVPIAAYGAFALLYDLGRGRNPTQEDWQTSRKAGRRLSHGYMVPGATDATMPVAMLLKDGLAVDRFEGRRMLSADV